MSIITATKDPESLKAKYAVAKALGLRGVGPFTFDDLDYTGMCVLVCR